MADEGKKFDQDKMRMELISPDALEGLARVLTHGSTKYGSRNWERGINYGRVFGALQRHLWAWFNGETYDPETEENHIYHALCNVMFLSHFESDARKYEKFDDRPNTEKKEPCGWCGEVGEEKSTEATSEVSQVAPVVAGIPVKYRYKASCDFCGHLRHDSEPGCTACDIIEAPGGPCSYKNQSTPQGIE